PLLLIAALPACQKVGESNSGSSKVAVNPNAPKLELFVMSQCPYGTQVVDAVAEVKKQLGAGVDIQIDYIGGGTPGALTAMHGPSEVTGNIAQLCALEIAPEKFFDFTTCQNKNMRAVDTNWKECAPAAG